MNGINMGKVANCNESHIFLCLIYKYQFTTF